EREMATLHHHLLGLCLLAECLQQPPHVHLHPAPRRQKACPCPRLTPPRPRSPPRYRSYLLPSPADSCCGRQ
ncbi:hypothetical protein COO60DRAFT_1508406, partial [Scenedesmus sp. NREL 46B-D3]